MAIHYIRVDYMHETPEVRNISRPLLQLATAAAAC